MIDLYSIKPLDAGDAALARRARSSPPRTTGRRAGSARPCSRALGDADERPPVVRLAVHEMPHSGKPAELLAEAGIDADGIAAAARQPSAQVKAS